MRRRAFLIASLGLLWPADLLARALGVLISVPSGPLSGSVPVSVSVSPTKRLQRVELFVDASLVGSDSTAPYAFTWNTASVADGSHTLRADAVYPNRRSSGSVVVEVDNVTEPAPVPPPPPPAPTPGTLYPNSGLLASGTLYPH